MEMEATARMNSFEWEIRTGRGEVRRWCTGEYAQSKVCS